ncbi:GNAT family N-acetyltransferase [Actinomycetospora chiangmaiensis]|uniref:GNAT family N-acetyltransferase n=1 Tax=Actinomycetospora chiangmaiensis TaxID=402650 RepID=UPI00036E7EEC|nr:GNAT family N-acyltransferase [Actinomycetospora chiangmaiensis]
MTSTEVLLTTGTGPTAPAGPAPARDDVPGAGAGDSGRYSLLVSRDTDAVHAAQRLRHDVFAVEQGARLAPGAAADEGRDEDRFDAFCDHLMVRDDTDGSIVGTYRMLTPEGAAEAGGLYSDTEFDLRRLDPLRPRLVEVGRSCVHPDHRTGTVLSLVWAGMWRYLVLSGHRWLVGCASVPLTAAGELPGAVWSLVREKHYAPEERRAVPHRPAPIGPDEGRRAARAQTPPLLRGYLRLGAEIGGAPAIDPDFGVADLLVLLDHTAIDPRWRRYLLGEDA